ncbi:purine and uridine phosphorylase [Xylaria venustula]|nr:purine and uridine phosphorylase [Xylaria venustula]
MTASQRCPSPPRSQDDFEIAIMCALPLEANAVIALFDKCWDSKRYHRAPGDTNTYTTGAIGRHNIVLVHLPSMGKVAAATSATYLRASYTGIRLSLVVGICGGVPSGKSPKDEEVLLGDVVISDGIIQYDFGRQFPHGFIRKGHFQDSLPRPSPSIRAFLAMLQAKRTQKHLQENTIRYLNDLQRTLDIIATYPGITEDRLFKPTYKHKHHDGLRCPVCNSWDGVCDEALTLSCEELGCDEHELVTRKRPESLSGIPIIHFGLFASSDSVMKSGEARNQAASRDGIIAFEIEGASVCDYADSHKSKRWQAYAAATAAATTKAILEYWSAETADALSPFSRRDLVLREPDTPPMDPARRVAILKALYTSPYRDRKERNPDRVLGTCEWFVTDNRFTHWLESQSSCMLLVSADPGCGKSVLAKYLIDSELPTSESRVTCYFFFKDDFADQSSARSALCCILHQLFEQKTTLLSNKIVERFEAGGENITGSFAELWDVLLTASQNNNAGEVVCILDAFDECDDQGRSDFTRCLRKLYSESNTFNLKFLLTSRPYGHIRRGFQPLEIPGLSVIRLSGEMETEMSKITKEIDIYLRSRVRGIRESLKLDFSEENVLLQELLRIPNRTYIWAHLTLDHLSAYEVISRLPRTVDEAYERNLSRSPNIQDAKKLLHIVIAAARPMTTNEMNVALAIQETSRSYKDLDLKADERFREHCKMVPKTVRGARIFSSN